MTWSDLLVGVAVLLGLVGIVVPVLPGSALIFAAVLVWAVLEASAAGWAVLAGVTLLLVTGGIVKYLLPGRRLRAEGIPHRTLLTGAALALVGFFVLPVVGLLVGFVGGVYLAEHRRVGREAAWPSTRHAVVAAGLSVLIELTAALLAAAVWLGGAIWG